MTYADFLASKRTIVPTMGPSGTGEPSDILFPFQRDLTRWAVRKGRAALFADTGLGKTFMQLEWARLTGERTLILAPLSVARQTVREAAKLGLTVTYSRGELHDGITITNYEMAEHFDPSQYGAVVLDESSILKALDGKTRKRLTEMFSATPYRLCCTATPAPNDIAEIGNHAEFLGIMAHHEMLSAFFVHGSSDEKGGKDGWRLKGHAEEAFYRWLASWSMAVRKPSDIGYEDDGFALPPLTVRPEFVEADYVPEGQLFFGGLKGITDRSAVRRATLEARVERVTAIIKQSWATTEHSITATGTPRTETANGSTSDATASLGPPNRSSKYAKSDEPITDPIPSRSKRTSAPTTSGIQKRSALDDSSGPMGSRSPSTSAANATRMAAVSSATSVSLSTSTTTTPPAKFEDSSALTATPRSASSLIAPSDYAVLPTTSKDQWVVWCGLNEEQDRLAAAFGDDCVSVYGSLPPEEKERRIEQWLDGEVAILLSKPAICGFGLNLQQAHRMAFVGLSDSWEAYYQSIRRCWRFGQTKPVEAVIVLSDAEAAIYENVMGKEQEAKRMQERLIEHVADFERGELADRPTEFTYEEDTIVRKDWTMMLGDSVERIAEIPTESVDLSVFSPPFRSLFTYSPSERDIGNVKNQEEFDRHFGYLIESLLRVTKPGRNCAVHVQQVPTTMAHDGVTGLSDFRGDVIRSFIARGWTFHGEVTIDKDPQAQAIRTKAKGLLFVQKERDRSWLRPAFADYILVFRKPGDNAVPIRSDEVSNDNWIEWARPIWYGIRESQTLNAAEAREQRDERHIAALQLETVRRCVLLWSNADDTILDPFTGIGTTGYVSVQNGRRFVGCELKRSYFEAACRNIERAGGVMSLGLFEPEAIPA